jgi:type I restriction enzyme, R subunit
VNLVTGREAEGRVYVSTYPTMMGLIDETRDGQRRFGVGHFDLVVIDEAHRSVYQKYGAIFDYFDSYLVGLTATPKDEVDINTYQLFDLERGVPTDAYPLGDAINDGFLVPPLAVTVPGKFQREGIVYKDRSEEEKDEWDAIEWDEEGNRPEKIEPAALNAWLFNKDTVDKVLADLMTRGQTVAGGDRLGKTIIFAKNQAHAQFIVERFDTNFPHLKGAFARGIYHSVPYAQTLIDDFSNADKAPHIAISVDMLDTGIDVPEVVNLVFFKMVRSKTKFWQMVGRGTRLRPDLFGPGQDKANFYILDYCGNLEFFSQDLPTTQGRIQESLGKRLFVTRLELIGEIDRQGPEADAASVRVDAAGLLHEEVAAMNIDNFVVRPKRKYVEQYKAPEAWKSLQPEDLTTLADEVAGLPSELDAEDEDAKRFDLLMLNLQLAVLRIEPSFARLRDQVKAIAGLLDEQASIPMIRQHLELIEDVQSDEWWQDVTVPMLEHVRLKLRALIRLIEKRKRAMIFTDFEDALGSAETVTLVATPGSARIAADSDRQYAAVSTAPETVTVSLESFEKFKQKARAFLRKHDDNLAIYRLRTNKPLTATDLESLEAMLAENGIGEAAVITRAAEDSQGLGLFVRGLVGLDRGAAKEAFAGFLAGKTLSANQIEFVDLIINYLTDHGVMSAARLYESPFTDIAPHGPDDLFTFDEVNDLVLVLSQIRSAAVAA